VFDGNYTTYGLGSAIYSFSGTELNIICSTFANHEPAGSPVLYLFQTNAMLTSSIIAFNTCTYPVENDWGSVSAAYLDVFGNSGGNYVGGLQGQEGILGNFSEDPLFVNHPFGDLHLTEDSPCIDAGDPLLPYDPDNTVSDVGAYYYDQSFSPLSLVVETMYDPWLLPPSGGIVEFSALIVNNTDQTVSFDGWTMITLPDGSVFGPLMSAHPTLLPYAELFVESLSQMIPDWAPEGDYTLTANVGIFPSFIVDSGEIFITKMIRNSGTPERVGSVEEWSTLASGWNTTTEFVVEQSDLPQTFALGNAYPNPFNATTTLSLTLPETRQVEVTLVDVLGRQVMTVLNGMQSAGTHQLTIDGSRLASGMYLLRASVDGYSDLVQKIVLMR